MFFIFIVSELGNMFYWYSLVWYFDIIMHTLGGLWVGMFFSYIFSRQKDFVFTRRFCSQVLLATIVVGILWEFYEFYIYQIVEGSSFDFLDTASDVMFDTLGASAALLYFFKSIVPGLKNKVQS